jgi:membrane fusion protein
MRSPFRPEALENERHRLSGEVILAVPLSEASLAWGLAVLLAAAVIFASLATYARKNTVTGVLVPDGGLIRVVARDVGVVEDIHVTEGQEVRDGAAIARLRLSAHSSSGDTADALRSGLDAEQSATAAEDESQRTRLAKSRIELQARLENLKRKRDAVQVRIRLLREQRGLADTSATRYADLFAKGIVTRSTSDNARITALTSAQSLASSEADAAEVSAQISDTLHQISALPDALAGLEAEAAQHRAALAQRHVSLEAQTENLTVAPRAGRVVAIPIEMGETVSVGGTVAVMVPQGAHLIAELYVPSNAAGFVRPGQPVRLMYQAYPYQTFGAARGVITSVSKTLLTPAELRTPGITVSAPVFRVRARLSREDISAYGHSIPLQPGMLLTADIVTERRTLIRWLFDPLFAVSKRS